MSCRRRDKSRVISYRVEIEDDSAAHVEALLARAKLAGTVTIFDGLSRIWWWQGALGKAMRAVRDAVGGTPAPATVRLRRLERRQARDRGKPRK